MNPTTTEAVARSNDLAAQARREKPVSDSSVPTPNLRDGASPSPQAAAEERSAAVAVSGGAAVGAAAGAAVGATVGGPVGAVVGGAVGGVAGALGGVAAGTANIGEPAATIPGPQEREVTRVGEAHQENLRR